MEKTKKIYQFKGLSKAQKNDLKKAYFKREWKNLLMSYLFIILSSSKPILSRNNGAIYVSIWFTLSIILSVYFYVNQSDYMSRKRNAEKYIKKHKSAEVEIGSVFFPEIGGWGFIGMQFLVTNVVFLPFLPLPIYLQFKSFETYKEVYMELFIGVFADTVILVFFNGILQHIIDSIYDYSNGITTMKKTKISLTKKKHSIPYRSNYYSIQSIFSLL